jgi:tRNA/rRNA methyltransferase
VEQDLNLHHPTIILVEPHMPNNIGSVARAMLNFGLKDLRIVKPLLGWPQPQSYTMASGANIVLDHASIFETLGDAIGDLEYVIASTARKHDVTKHVYFPKEGVQYLNPNLKTGIVFGREKNGLENDEVALCDAMITIPNNPDFSSLNLSQAVLLVAYEWFQWTYHNNLETKIIWRGGFDDEKIATKAEVLEFLGQFEEVLDRKGYFRTQDKKPIMLRTLNNMFTREKFTSQEIRSLRGVLRSLGWDSTE